MRINRKLTAISFILFLVTIMGACASKKSVVPADTLGRTDSRVASSVIEDALKQYTDWSTVRMNGKIKISSLPVNPSIKIYMKRGKEITISASAILVGEVFRVELNEDSLLMVNKLKKVYCQETAEKVKSFYPTLCEELQSLFLGRMIVPGAGTLSADNLDRVAIELEKGMRKVTPRLDEFPVEIAFNYLLNNDGSISITNLMMEGNKKLIELNYEWEGNGGKIIDVEANIKSKKINVEIDLDSPKWDARPLAPISLGKGYERVGIDQFFKRI